MGLCSDFRDRLSASNGAAVRLPGAMGFKGPVGPTPPARFCTGTHGGRGQVVGEGFFVARDHVQRMGASRRLFAHVLEVHAELENVFCGTIVYALASSGV